MKKVKNIKAAGKENKKGIKFRIKLSIGNENKKSELKIKKNKKVRMKRDQIK